MNKLSFALGFSLFICTNIAQAADQSGFTPIAQFDMWPTGAVLYFSGSPDSNNSCGGDATQFHLLKTQTSFAEIYASLLTAYASRTKVRLRYDCSGTDALISAARSIP
jgi:hypothetical protein